MIALALAAALVGVDRPIVTGADYVQACQGEDPRQQAACASYLTATIATADAFHADSLRRMGEAAALEPTRFFCPTGGVEELEEHAVAAIVALPALGPRPAAEGILTGVLNAYPCAEPTAPEADAPDSEDDDPFGG